MTRLWRQFRSVMFLWVLFFTVGFFSQPTFAYGLHGVATIVYDAPSLSAFDYDHVSVSSANESGNVSAETGRNSCCSTCFLAAEGTGAFSRLAQPGGLMVSEDAGGHLLARHVGLTDADLAARAE